MNVSLIIMALNEAECIGRVLDDVDDSVISEVLVIDGGSTDGTQDLVRRAGYKVMQQEGEGWGNAFLTGIKFAKGEVITLVDADGSYNQSDIPKLLDVLNQGYDIAYGSRYLPGARSDDDTVIRWFGNKLFTALVNLVHGVSVSDSLYLFIATRKKVIESLKLSSSGFELCVEFSIKAYKAGYTHKEIPSIEKARIAGHSKVNALTDGFRILRTILRRY